MADDNRRAIERIVELHQRIYVTLRSSLAEQWMGTDYTMPQLKVLLYLYTDGSSRMTDLATALRVSLPSATGIISRLAHRALVFREQDPQDRRLVICCLSPEGERQIAELWTASFDVFRRVLRPLSLAELDEIARAAEVMLEAAEHSDEETMVKGSPRATSV